MFLTAVRHDHRDIFVAMRLAALRIIREPREAATEDYDKREERETAEEGVDEVFDVFHMCTLIPCPIGVKGGIINFSS
jgi:hypothetical protein